MEALLPWLPFPPPLWLQVLIVALWVGGVTLVAEELSRRNLASSETVRKIVHIGTGNVIVLAWWLNTPTWLGIGASVLFGAIALLSYKFPLLPGINSVGRKSLGTFFYAVSIGVLTAIYWDQAPQFAVIGILIMTWGDGLAALIGQRFGKHPYTIGDLRKSWEGSLTMALVSFAVTLLMLLVTQGFNLAILAVSLTVAIAATALETFSKYGVDNLTVPLGSAAIAYLLS